jgi:hypothetical protein
MAISYSCRNPECKLEICQKVVDGVSQAGIMAFYYQHHDTHAQLIHTIQRRDLRCKLSLPKHT